MFRTDSWGCLTDACRRSWIGTKRRGASGRAWSAAASPESPRPKSRHGSRSTNATIRGYSRGRFGTGWSRRESATGRARQASRRSPGFWEVAIPRTRRNLATVSLFAFQLEINLKFIRWFENIVKYFPFRFSVFFLRKNNISSMTEGRERREGVLLYISLFADRFDKIFFSIREGLFRRSATPFLSGLTKIDDPDESVN